MVMDGNQGDWMGLLRQKGIRPGGFFRLGERYYAYRRSGRITDLWGEPAALSENDLWEGYDQLQRVRREQFEQAREEELRRRRARYGLSEERLEALARRFAAAYPEHPEEWRFICQYEEAAIRLILQRVVEGEGRPQGGRRFDELFHQVALAKAAAALKKGKG